MKEKIIHFTFCCLCIFILFFLFWRHNEIAVVIINAGSLFFSKVFVSLFPMFLLNDFLIGLQFPYYFSYFWSKYLQKIFHISGIGAYFIFFSMISGTPTNVYILKELISDELISVEDANHYLLFTYFSNPLFLINMLTYLFSKNVAIKIILIHFLSNFILLFLFYKKIYSYNTKLPKFHTNHFRNILNHSLKKSINTLLIVLGSIVFYMLLSFFITNIIHYPLFKVLISGFLEITNGLSLINTLNISFKIKEMIAIFIISFGGLSIHTQVSAILEDTSLQYSYFFKGRLYQTIISVILGMIIL